MSKAIDIFSNRELALFSWIIVIIILVLLSNKSRPAFIHLLKMFFKRRVIGMQLITWSYISCVILVFFFFGLWNSSMIKDTLIWTLFTSFLMIIALFTPKKGQHLKDVLFDTFKTIVIFEFIVNMYTFSFALEMIIIFILAIIVGMIAVAEQDSKNQIVVNFLNWVLTIWGAYVLYYCSREIWLHFNSIEWSQTLLDFLFPIWITILFIPFIYGLRKYAKWEMNRTRREL